MKSLKATYQKSCSTTKSPQGKRITTLGIVPEISCTRSCVYCYEKHKEYDKETLTDADFIKLVTSTIDDLPNVEEVMIDHNPSHDGRLVKEIVKTIPKELGVLITTTPDGIKDLLDLNVRFSISVHSKKDIVLLQKAKETLGSKLECASLVCNEVTAGMRLQDVVDRVYVNQDKFCKEWLDICGQKTAPTPILIGQMIVSIGAEVVEVDHCLSTVLNGQECPAYTQLNLYKDGSIRRCPYAPSDQSNTDDKEFSHGCYLAREMKIGEQQLERIKAYSSEDKDE